MQTIKSMNKKELRALYNIGVKTFQKWCKLTHKAHPDDFPDTKNKYVYNPKQIKCFMEHNGEPE